MTGDRAVARIAEAQHGVVAVAQLYAVGLGRGAIAHRVAQGRLHRVHRGVYRVGHVGSLPLAREMAAVLAFGPRAVLSCRSAALLWGLLSAFTGDVEVTVPTGARRRGIRAHRSALAAEEVTRCRRIPVTTPDRTLVDVAARTPAADLEGMIADALRRQLVTRRSLLSALERAPGRRGSAAMRAFLLGVQGPQLTRSEAERRLLELVRAARLPLPEHNVAAGGYELDVLWRAERLAIEVDGYAYHSSRPAFERDRARDADLQAAGLRVMRVTWRQLVEEPEAVAARLGAALLA